MNDLDRCLKELHKPTIVPSMKMNQFIVNYKSFEDTILRNHHSHQNKVERRSQVEN